MTGQRRTPRRAPLVLTALAAVTTVLTGACAGATSTDSPAVAGTAATSYDPDSYDAATRADPLLEGFRHGFADVDGVGMHYVTGGSGPPLVLLHGWPQTWYSWHEIMPALAGTHTVYAIDLPGLGDSRGTPTGYDKATLARYVHGLVAGRLGLDGVRIAGHDLGAAVAFQYAAQFPGDVDRLAYLDLPLPGPAMDAATYRTLSWHIALHSQEEVPEAIVGDDVREYLALFYPQVAFGGTAFGGPGADSPFDDAELDEYARTYGRPEVLAGGFDLYRALGDDVADTVAAAPITTPTLVLAAQGQGEAIRSTVAPRATAIERTAEVPGAGHWLVEENPEFVTGELLRFFGP